MSHDEEGFRKLRAGVTQFRHVIERSAGVLEATGRLAPAESAGSAAELKAEARRAVEAAREMEEAVHRALDLFQEQQDVAVQHRARRAPFN